MRKQASRTNEANENMPEKITCRIDHLTCRNMTCVNMPKSNMPKHAKKNMPEEKRAENMSIKTTCRSDRKKCRNRTCTNKPAEQNEAKQKCR